MDETLDQHSSWLYETMPGFSDRCSPNQTFPRPPTLPSLTPPPYGRAHSNASWQRPLTPTPPPYVTPNKTYNCSPSSFLSSPTPPPYCPSTHQHRPPTPLSCQSPPPYPGTSWETMYPSPSPGGVPKSPSVTPPPKRNHNASHESFLEDLVAPPDTSLEHLCLPLRPWAWQNQSSTCPAPPTYSCGSAHLLAGLGDPPSSCSNTTPPEFSDFPRHSMEGFEDLPLSTIFSVSFHPEHTPSLLPYDAFPSSSLSLHSHHGTVSATSSAVSSSATITNSSQEPFHLPSTTSTSSSACKSSNGNAFHTPFSSSTASSSSTSASFWSSTDQPVAPSSYSYTNRADDDDVFQFLPSSISSSAFSLSTDVLPHSFHLTPLPNTQQIAGPSQSALHECKDAEVPVLAAECKAEDEDEDEVESHQVPPALPLEEVSSFCTKELLRDKVVERCKKQRKSLPDLSPAPQAEKKYKLTAEEEARLLRKRAGNNVSARKSRQKKKQEKDKQHGEVQVLEAQRHDLQSKLDTLETLFHKAHKAFIRQRPEGVHHLLDERLCALRREEGQKKEQERLEMEAMKRRLKRQRRM
ncbi:uncharacterized protein [Littorina saxatilis]|uniref:BZIP domain-containing protein n=1 Tax=Littorina saxatilis TaxID=31220 RepID=A0AAN9AL07_9CAEN